MKLISLLLVIALLLGGCKNNDAEYSNAKNFEVASEMAPSAPMRAMADEMISAKPEGITPMVIRNAYISIEIDDYTAIRPKIDSLITLFKGRIVNENMQNSDYQKTNDFTIRVPATSLDKMQTAIVGLAKRVDYQRVESTDVTEEYIDLEARLSNQKKVEETFLKLLRKTESVEEILKIETKLSEIRSQIESSIGRMKYLKTLSEFSTIYLTLYQKIDFKYEPERPKPFTERFKQALTLGWRGVVTFMLIVIGLWPIWLLGAAVWTGIIYFKRRKKRMKAELKNKKKEKKPTAHKINTEPKV
jgi:PBP1b-binding outer membrane lipoprotein LpoB